MQEEMKKTDALILQSGYTGPIHFRAPYGVDKRELKMVLYMSQRPHIVFDILTDDFLNADVDVIVNHAVSKAVVGSIIALHDGDSGNVVCDRSELVKALPIMIKQLRDKGFNFYTISELLNMA